MKKKILMGILGLTLLLPFGVNAEEVETLNKIEEGNNSANAPVTVGEVDVPTYEVNIYWDDLTFDWVYNSTTREFEWAPANVCRVLSNSKETVENALKNGEKVYTDSNCTIATDKYVENSEQPQDHYQIHERESAFIGIEDMSTNGQIAPSIMWNAKEKYDEVTADIKYYGESCVRLNTSLALEKVIEILGKVWTDDKCTQGVPYEELEELEFGSTSYYAPAYTLMELNTTEIPNNGRASAAGFGVANGSTEDFIGFAPIGYPRNQYRVEFDLVGGETTPTTGDEIGTITITIRTAN